MEAVEEGEFSDRVHVLHGQILFVPSRGFQPTTHGGSRGGRVIRLVITQLFFYKKERRGVGNPFVSFSSQKGCSLGTLQFTANNKTSLCGFRRPKLVPEKLRRTNDPPPPPRLPPKPKSIKKNTGKCAHVSSIAYIYEIVTFRKN